jgi:hypothetical protein
MTPSALRTTLPLHLASLHARSHQDITCAFDLLSTPTQLNILTDHLATDALVNLRAAANTTEFYLLPACRVYLRDGTGYITSHEKSVLATEIPSTNSVRTSHSAKIGPTTSMIPSAGLPTD